MLDHIQEEHANIVERPKAARDYLKWFDFGGEEVQIPFIRFKLRRSKDCLKVMCCGSRSSGLSTNPPLDLNLNLPHVIEHLITYESTMPQRGAAQNENHGASWK